MTRSDSPPEEPGRLPENLPAPEDDGAANHLAGTSLPGVALPRTAGGTTCLADLAGTVVLFCYPMTGVPGVTSSAGWDLILGARGCTAEACSFRDHFAELRTAGAALYGISTQSRAEQREAADRLHLPYPLLSDRDLVLARALRLPLFTAGARTLLKRLTIVARAGKIVKVFYPVFPPDRHATEVLAWLESEL
jgi:peroxiredoxin